MDKFKQLLNDATIEDCKALTSVLMQSIRGNWGSNMKPRVNAIYDLFDKMNQLKPHTVSDEEMQLLEDCYDDGRILRDASKFYECNSELLNQAELRINDAYMYVTEISNND